MPRDGILELDVMSNMPVSVQLMDENNFRRFSNRRNVRENRVVEDQYATLDRVGESVQSKFIVSDRKYGTPVHILIEIAGQKNYYSFGRNEYQWYAVAHQAFGNRQLRKLRPSYMNF